ncbi:YDG/SRA domain-containing protein [Streptomyces sp. NPDC050636]|uniref:YDG/SRA domain-containing protein n=1 Tax=Streptomyces sp. NPDC050636 TaxID=3154510 RepID=UPI0034323A60
MWCWPLSLPVLTECEPYEVATRNCTRRVSAAHTARASLVLLGRPVRVVRGLKVRGKKWRRATGGYEYCGLFRVADHWMTVGKEGFLVCRFKLLKLAPGETLKPQPLPSSDSEDTGLEEKMRCTIEYERRIRDSTLCAQ